MERWPCLPGIYRIGFATGILSLFVFTAGVLGRLDTTSLIIILSTVLSALFWSFWRHRKSSGIPQPWDWRHILPLFFALIMLPIVLLPPTARDELIMHLVVPKHYLEAGRMFELASMNFSYFPMNIDLLYLIPMAFGNDILPKLNHFGFALLTGFTIYFYLSEKLDKKYAILGLFLFLTTPVVMQLSTTAYIDLGLTFYATLALIAILKWREKLEIIWLILSAIATGFAMGSKYSAFILCAIFCFTISWHYSRATKDQFKALRLGLLYLLISLAVVSPWLIRNYLWTHNPVYPLMNGIFTATAGGAVQPGVSSLSPLGKRGLLYGEELWYILLVPFRMFWEGRDGSPRFFDGVLNPLFLVFSPLAFIRIRNRDIKYLAFFSAVFFFVAFFRVDLVTRYVLPILPAMVIFSVYGFKNAFEMKRLRLYALAVMIALFVVNGWYLTGLYNRYRPMAYLKGEETKEQYLSRRLPDYSTIAFANATLPVEARVLSFFGGDRLYYWDRNCLSTDRLGNDLIRFVRGARNEHELGVTFKEMGLTHLFINDPLFMEFSRNNFDKNQLGMLERFFKADAQKLYEKNGFALYRL